MTDSDPQTEPIHVGSAAEFDDLIDSTPHPVLVDFYAEWCGPCTLLEPVIVDFAAAHDDVLVLKVDAESVPELSRRFEVRGVPTLLVLENGEPAEKQVGFTDEAGLVSLLAKAV